MSKIFKVAVFIGIFLTIFISGCSKKKSTKPEPPDTIISDKVVVLEEETGVSLDTVKDSTYTFTFTGQPPKVLKNDILVGTEGGGYLRRVVSITTKDNSITLQTGYTVLTDAIIKGSLDTTIQLSIEKLHKQTGQGLGLISAAKGVSVADGIINLSGVELFSGKVGGTDVTVSIIEGSISFNPALDLGFEIENSRIKEFHALAKGTLAFNCDLGVTASDEFTYSKEVNIATFKHIAVQFVGPVPIVEVITLSFDAGFESAISIGGTTEFGFESNIVTSFGARYRNGAWSTVWDKETNLIQHPVIWKAEAEAQIRGYIKPSISIDLYAVAGPYLEVEPYLAFTGEITSYPLWYWYWRLYGGIEGDLGFRVSILSNTLFDYSAELFNWEMTIAADSNHSPDTPSNPSPSNGATNQSIDVDLSWTGGDPDGDPVTYDVYFGTTTSPPLVSPGQTSTTYDPGPLSYDTKYYWKIVCKDNRGTQTPGPVWNFTTRALSPHIFLNPTSLTFSATQNGSLPSSKTLTLTNTGGGTLNWSVSDNTTWLDVSPASGNSNSATIIVSVNTTNLSPGTYNATITVSSSNANNSPQTVGVSYVVSSSSPHISLNPTSLSFSATQNGSLPSSKTFTITNTGGGTLNWSVSDNATWLDESPTSGNSNSATITVSVNTTNLSPGTYNTTVTVSSSNANNSPQTVGVSYVVSSSSPHISLNPTSLSFSATQNGSLPSSKAFTITNTGGGTLNWSVSDNTTWLDVSPTSGNSNSATITASVNTTNLSPGTYNATITVSSSNANNSPQTVGVSYVVSATGNHPPEIWNFDESISIITVIREPVHYGWIFICACCGFCVSGEDPDGDSIYALFDWGDGTQNQSRFYCTDDFTGARYPADVHAWNTTGQFTVKARLYDIHGASSNWLSNGTVTVVEGSAPNRPSRPTGPTSFPANTEQSFAIDIFEDPDGDAFWITSNWGDGTTTTGGGSCAWGGGAGTFEKTYTKPGVYYIKAQAKDWSGHTSGWSDSLKVNVQ